MALITAIKLSIYTGFILSIIHAIKSKDWKQLSSQNNKEWPKNNYLYNLNIF